MGVRICIDLLFGSSVLLLDALPIELKAGDLSFDLKDGSYPGFGPLLRSILFVEDSPPIYGPSMPWPSLGISLIGPPLFPDIMAGGGIITC